MPQIPPCPYRGLAPFREHDAKFYYGRRRDTDIVVANLTASRLTILYGASGVGKTSLLLAGVSPEIQRLGRLGLGAGELPEDIIAICRAWRFSPIEQLVRAIRSAARNQAGISTDELNSADTLRSLIALLNNKNVVVHIVLDQFDEFLLYHGRTNTPNLASVQICELINDREVKVSFMIALREDALARLDHLKGLLPNLFENTLRLRHLDAVAATEAIEKPLGSFAKIYGADKGPVEVEKQLVDSLLDQVMVGFGHVVGLTGSAPVGELDNAVQIETPYLQLVLERLWHAEVSTGSRAMRNSTLVELGGPGKIVRDHFRKAMDALPAENRNAATRVLPYLVTPSRGKMAMSVYDLARYAGLPETAVLAVLDPLAAEDSRILRTVDPPKDQPRAIMYEIYHDVLAQPILDWVAQSRSENAKSISSAETIDINVGQITRRVNRIDKSLRSRGFRHLANFFFSWARVALGGIGLWIMVLWLMGLLGLEERLPGNFLAVFSALVGLAVGYLWGRRSEA